MRSRIGLTALLAVALTGCWGQQGADGGKSFASAWPTAINGTNVGGLQRQFSVELGDIGDSRSVIWGGKIFLQADTEIRVYDASGAAGCQGVPITCAPLWVTRPGAGQHSYPMVIDGRVWSTERNNHLVAFDAAGIDHCQGSPRVCDALVDVTAPTSGAYLTAGSSDRLLVLGNVPGPTVGTTTNSVLMFNGSGALGWKADLDTSQYPSNAGGVIDGDTVYARTGIGATGPVAAFDARGVTGCSGSPKVCAPLWTTSGPGSGPGGVNQIAARDGRLYVSEGPFISAYDGTASASCAGSPKVCSPVWQAIGPANTFAVTHDHVFAAATGSMNVFPLDKVGCGGDLLACLADHTMLTFLGSSTAKPMVAGNVVYVVSNNQLQAFSADGSAHCDVTTRRCSALWTGRFANVIESPMVVGDWLYVTGYVGDAGTVGLAAFRVP